MSRVTRPAGRGGGTESGTAQQAVLLFKIVSVRDEVVIGLAPEQLSALGGNNAGAVGKAISRNGELTAWQFAVRRRKNGRLEQAPLRQVSILGHESIRVEPYATPLPVVPIHHGGGPDS